MRDHDAIRLPLHRHAIQRLLTMRLHDEAPERDGQSDAQGNGEVVENRGARQHELSLVAAAAQNDALGTTEAVTTGSHALPSPPPSHARREGKGRET